MGSKLSEKVKVWAETRADVTQTYDKIDFLAKKLYHTYEPTTGQTRDFFVRLNNWIENVDGEDQLTLFNFVPEIFYLGPEEMKTIYIHVYKNNIFRWLVNCESIGFTETDIDAKLEEAVKETWFCPITDSLNINLFYNINRIPAVHTYRPEWRTIKKFGDKERIRRYIEGRKNKIKRLVLLEDFVGSGTQMSGAVTAAAEMLYDREILVIPLVIGPKGLKKANELADQLENVTFSPGIKIGESMLIPESGGTIEQMRISNLAFRNHNRVLGGEELKKKPERIRSKTHYLGFKKTGSLIVKHSNTPNNSLPLIHYVSDTWNALFPRNDRG